MLAPWLAGADHDAQGEIAEAGRIRGTPVTFIDFQISACRFLAAQGTYLRRLAL